MEKIVKVQTYRKKDSAARLIVNLEVNKKGNYQFRFQIRGAKDIAERNEMMNTIAQMQSEIECMDSIDARFPDYALQGRAEAIEQMEADLATLKAEENKQYWTFTRTARGWPVDPAICRQISDLENQIRALKFPTK